MAQTRTGERTRRRPRRQRILSALLFLWAVGTLALLVHSGPARGETVSLRQADPQAMTAGAPPAGQVARGKEVFLRDCAWCHGDRGEGSQYAPPIADKGEADADFWLSTGRMPLSDPNQPVRAGPPAYSSDVIDALVSYVGTLGTGPAVPVVEPGDIERGRDIFLYNCAPCHSSSGTGMALPAGEYAPDLFSDDPTQVAEAIRLGPGSMPNWSDKSLDQEQVDAVASYVQQLGEKQNIGGAPIARLGPIPEGFIAWVVGIPLLLIVIRLLGKKAP